MDIRTIELSKYRVEKAKADLETSEALFEMKRFSQSLNRSYYAMFHATRALLAYDKFDSKRHSGILAFFNQQYIKPGKIDIKYFTMLTLALWFIAFIYMQDLSSSFERFFIYLTTFNVPAN